MFKKFLVVIASVFTIGAVASVAAQADDYVGTGGSDAINTQNSVDSADDVNSKGGDDQVTTLNGADDVFAGTGNDKVFTGDGDDGTDNGRTLVVGAVNGFNGDDVLALGAGNDLGQGGDGTDKVRGNRGSDTLWGNFGADIVQGGNGEDTIYPGPGKDYVLAGNHNDSVILSTDGTRDDINCGDGDDVVIVQSTDVDPKDNFVDCETTVLAIR